ncbi:Rossmann-fold NAD(P)-binding domain-containing protein [Sphaerisporangium aureirubrum]|uniref:Uncharacterized protein n=1 Tax=Sphaerisporangium aureirubrum TaxID=1544736 RepID=A0ABW1NC70_9ACTN
MNDVKEWRLKNFECDRFEIVNVWATPCEGPHRVKAEAAIRAALENALAEGHEIQMTVGPCHYHGGWPGGPRMSPAVALERIDSAGGAFPYTYESSFLYNGNGSDDAAPPIPTEANITIYFPEAPAAEPPDGSRGARDGALES